MLRTVNSSIGLKRAKLLEVEQSRRAFCGNIACFTVGLAFFPFAEFFASCGTKKSIVRPSVQLNNTDVITNTRYIGDAFAFPEHMVSASLVPKMNKLPSDAQGVSFIGIIAQDTLSFGCSSAKPCDIVRVGMLREKNGMFRYSYELQGIRQYAKGHIPDADYKYNIDFLLNSEGIVVDPDYPHETRFGYDFQVSSGEDSSIRIRGLQSSPVYANQLFVGVMDDGNNVHLPDNKQLQMHISVSGSEQAPSVIYKNEDETSQVSSQYSDSDYYTILTLTGSY